jgi:hypothetical protein
MKSRLVGASCGWGHAGWFLRCGQCVDLLFVALQGQLNCHSGARGVAGGFSQLVV